MGKWGFRMSPLTAQQPHPGAPASADGEKGTPSKGRPLRRAGGLQVKEGDFEKPACSPGGTVPTSSPAWMQSVCGSQTPDSTPSESGPPLAAGTAAQQAVKNCDHGHQAGARSPD